MLARRPKLLLITPPLVANAPSGQDPVAPILDVVLALGAALPVGSFAVQLRDKASDAAAIGRHAARLRKATAHAHAGLVINDGCANAHAIARDVGADGIHVTGRGDVDLVRELDDTLWISVPAHSRDDVLRARALGVDAVLVSPIFATPDKGSPRGTEALREARSEATRGGIAVYALGGVDAHRAAPCAAAGAHGVAAIRAVFDAPDPVAVARALIAPFTPADEGEGGNG